MPRLSKLDFALLLSTLLCATSVATLAESGILVVHVKDVQERPIAGLQIGVKGDGGSATTGDDGKARIALAKQTKENDWVSLQILHSPPGKDFMMVSPWDYGTFVPSFANESKNFVEITIVQRGDHDALVSGTVLKSLAEQINKANTLKTADKQAQLEDPKANLDAVAKQYGLAPADVDQAIRAWGAKTIDPYEAGLAALYERNYSRASTQFSDSLHKREEKLAADQKAVADAAFFLGQSLFGEGKYRDSATAFQRCLELRTDDGAVLNNLALSLTDEGDYAAAEPLYRRALAIDEKALGSDHPDVAIDLNNLAELLRDKGDYADAELLYRRALAIDEKALGPDHPEVATNLINLAELLRAKGDYADAEPLYRRALAIDEKALGPDHPDVAIDLNNLAELLQDNGDYADAEPLYRRALAIAEKAMGPDHPSVAIKLNNLASLLYAKRDYVGAEPLLRRALAIDEKALGPDHKAVATDLNNLASLLYAKGDYVGAEPLLRRALAIDEKALGPNHPTTRLYRRNLESLDAKIVAQRTKK
jgi:tetratricopeptide (TPR) repeat protein